MVNTIFYFVDDYATYRSEWDKGEISSKTICFINDVREIYVGGRAFGKTSTDGLVSESEFDLYKDAIDSALNDAKNGTDDLENRLEKIKNDLLEEITQGQTDLNTLHDEIEESVSDAVNTALTDQQSLRNNAILNDLIGEKIGEWSKTASLVTEGSNTWTTINNKVDSFSAVSNLVKGNFNDDGSLKSGSVLESSVKTKVDENEAISSLTSLWSNVEDNDKLVEWTAAGFKAEASKFGSLSEMYAATDDSVAAIKALAKKNGDAITSMRAGTKVYRFVETSLTSNIKDTLLILNLLVENNGVYTKSELVDMFGGTLAAKIEEDGIYLISDGTTSKYYNIKKEDISFAQVVTKSGKDYAVANLGLTLENNVAGILAQLNEHSSAINAITQYDSTTESYLLLESAVGKAISGLTAKNDESIASIIAEATPDMSSVTISADQITLAGTTFADKIMAEASQIGGFSIGDNELTNIKYGSSISIKNASKNPTKAVTIGNDAEDSYIVNKQIFEGASTGISTTCGVSVTNTTNDSEYNTGMYVDVENATYNYAIHGTGNAVFDGVVCGFRTDVINLDTLEAYSSKGKQMKFPDGSVCIFTGTAASIIDSLAGRRVIMPKLNDVRNTLGIINSPLLDEKAFSFRLTFVNKANVNIYLIFRGDSTDTQLPICRTTDGESMSNLRITPYGVMDIVFTFTPDQNGSGYEAWPIVQYIR